MTGGTHVVFGTGPAGRAVGCALVDQGVRVRMINRSGTPALRRVETIGGDATDPAFARDVAIDADTVYFCLNAPRYHRWAEEFPPLQRAVLRDTFGGHTTSGDDIVASTVEWYRTHATTPEISTGLADATAQKVTS
jgi:nucleoside-diphosphate-sugar epimerase